MPVTWCYLVEGAQRYCSTGFPIGCYVTKSGKQKDACVTNVSCTDSQTHGKKIPISVALNNVKNFIFGAHDL